MSQSNYSLSLPAPSTHSLPSTNYLAPPHTTHKLTQKDRMRLLKSTRKLTNVLGSTPHIASAPSAPAALTIPPCMRTCEPPTPRTKKARRTGRVFTTSSALPLFSSYNSSSTSLSSFDSEVESGEAEKEGYIVVRRGGATGYHYHHLDIPLPVNHRSQPIKVSLVPSSEKEKKGRKALSPPLLLRLCAVPVDNRHDSVLSTASSVHASALSPLSPTFPPPPMQAQTASQKVKKLNKLARTFGQPVPPELVFPAQSHTPSPEFLEKAKDKPQGPRLNAHTRRVPREGKKRAADLDAVLVPLPRVSLAMAMPTPPTPPASTTHPSSGIRVTQRVAVDVDSPHIQALPLPRVGLATAIPNPPYTQSKSRSPSLGVQVTQSRTQSGSLAQTPYRAPRPRSLTLLPPLPPLPSLHLSPLPAQDDSSEEEKEEEGCDTPPTSTEDLSESLREYIAPSSPHATAPLSPRHTYSQSTPNLRARPRPRTASSSASRTSEDKAHHRIPLPTQSSRARANTLDNRSSRAFYGIPSTDEQQGEVVDEKEYGHRREREWSGEWNVKVDDVRRLLRVLKAH